MPGASIGGLVSGLDTATIISQLIQLEARPQTLLKARLSTEQRAVTSLTTLNSKLASIATRAAELSKLDAWSPVKATSTSEHVTATARSGAVAASLTFTVGNVATRSVLDLGARALTDQMTDNGDTKVNFTKPDGTTVELNTGDGTVQGFVNALNGGSHGATATLVNLGNGSYRLNVTASTTGVKTIAVNAPSGSTMAVTGTLTEGEKASITVGADTITSDSNTFEDVMPGLDVTVTPKAVTTPAAAVTVDVVTDAQSLSDKVKAMVDATNAALSEIASLTAYDSETRVAGSLTGDGTLRNVRERLLSTFTQAIGGRSLSTFGIETDRQGNLTFDAATFKDAYADDPQAAAATFSAPSSSGGVVGLAAGLETLAKGFSNSSDGLVTTVIQGRSSRIDRLETDIDGWDVRLTQKRANLERQYGALEVALGKLQSQSSWLAGQINSLPSYSSGS